MNNWKSKTWDEWASLLTQIPVNSTLRLPPPPSQTPSRRAHLDLNASPFSNLETEHRPAANTDAGSGLVSTTTCPPLFREPPDQSYQGEDFHPEYQQQPTQATALQPSRSAPLLTSSPSNPILRAAFLNFLLQTSVPPDRDPPSPTPGGDQPSHPPWMSHEEYILALQISEYCRILQQVKLQKQAKAQQQRVHQQSTQPVATETYTHFGPPCTPATSSWHPMHSPFEECIHDAILRTRLGLTYRHRRTGESLVSCLGSEPTREKTFDQTRVNPSRFETQSETSPVQKTLPFCSLQDAAILVEAGTAESCTEPTTGEEPFTDLAATGSDCGTRGGASFMYRDASWPQLCSRKSPLTPPGLEPTSPQPETPPPPYFFCDTDFPPLAPRDSRQPARPDSGHPREKKRGGNTWKRSAKQQHGCSNMVAGEETACFLTRHSRRGPTKRAATPDVACLLSFQTPQQGSATKTRVERGHHGSPTVSFPRRSFVSRTRLRNNTGLGGSPSAASPTKDRVTDYWNVPSCYHFIGAEFDKTVTSNPSRECDFSWEDLISSDSSDLVLSRSNSENRPRKRRDTISN
ncbi:unnamed protein product [Cyprideis torosa]|uniref:Uncharacterized protein n=1 Tax=Cyprideis torosa TaxID=163714 RepID=A0A7R8WFC1_9CRUS|nr:unnamed protein product [Cyprideis torosa]CAG0895288.1 unnamed protein product [Cyprideis torosa]